MRHWRKLHRLLFSAFSLLLSGLLIGHCIAICRSGDFSRAVAAEHFGNIAWAFWSWLATLAAAVNYPASEQRAAKQKMSGQFPSIPPGRLLTWRIGLYLAAAGLVFAGIWNGGAQDVFVKAIQICTECVGLG